MRPPVPRQALHQGRAGQDEVEAGQEGDPGGQPRGDGAGGERREPGRLAGEGGVPAGEEPDVLGDQDQRPGRGLGQGQAVHHLGPRQPAIVGDGALGDERQHRVGPAEGDEGCLGEEHRDVGEGSLAGESEHKADRNDPERGEDQGQDREPPHDGAHADGGGRLRIGRGGMGGRRDDHAQPVGDEADQEGRADDPRKSDPQQAQAHEGPDGQGPGQRRLQRAPSDPQTCRGHQGHDDR